jgi:hypothetical protein
MGGDENQLRYHRTFSAKGSDTSGKIEYIAVGAEVR